MKEQMRKMISEMYDDIVCIRESCFAIRGYKGGDALAPIVTAVMPDGVAELRLYNDPNEQYLKVNSNDVIKSLELYCGYDDDDEFEYIGSWSVINGVIMK